MTSEEQVLLVPACVRILVGAGWGSGYLVSSDLIATCKHVTDGIPKGQSAAVEIAGSRVVARLFATDPNSDCAVLKLDEPQTGIKPLPLAGDCKAGSEWVGFGFPLVTKGGGLPLEGNVTLSIGNDDQEQQVRILFSPMVAAGMGTPINGFSGSPVMVNGYVIGHLKRVIGDPTMAPPVMRDIPPLPRTAYGLVYATPSLALLNLLKMKPAISVVQSRMVKQYTTTADQQEFQLFRQWFQTGAPTAGEALMIGSELINIGRFAKALKVLDFSADSVKVKQKRALALAKSNRIDESIRLLEILTTDESAEARPLKAETIGLMAGRLKQKWLQSRDPLFLRASYEAYLEAFQRDPRDTFVLINVAALALYRGDIDESKNRAKEVLGLMGNDPANKDNWQLATIGEAYLLLGDLAQARLWYERAANKNPMAVTNIAMMRLQARLTLKMLGKPIDTFDQALPVPRVAAFTGHMVDVEGRVPPRFPKEKVGFVRDAIREKLNALNVRYGFSSAARGADILFIEELLRRGGHPDVWLPFPHYGFIKTSVGEGWDERFMSILKDDRVDVTVLNYSVPSQDAQPEAYASCNFHIQKAATEKASVLDEKPILICVWNGNLGDGKGGTADAVRDWLNEGHQLEIIDISKL
jgi:tetratricopeptide (TPR) repeat protein